MQLYLKWLLMRLSLRLWIVFCLCTLILKLIIPSNKFYLIALLYKGLAQLSSATLTKARGYVLEHLIHTSPLRVAHLREFLTAVIEMELDDLLETEHDCLNAYLKKLTLQNRSLISVPDKKDFLKDSVISSQGMAPIKKNEKSIADDLTKYALQEILKRKCAVSCISAVERGLDVILNTIRHNSESDNKLLNEQIKHEKAPM